MSLIDWSDPDEMLGLLVEYVADEKAEARGDAGRAEFLNQLWEELVRIAEQNCDSAQQIALDLQSVLDDVPSDFADDPVMSHVEACIEELVRIGSSEPGRSAGS